MDVMYNINIINAAVLYMWKVLKEEILGVLITRKNMFLFL